MNIISSNINKKDLVKVNLHAYLIIYFVLGYIFMGIGSFLYEYLGIISPELGSSGAPTNSIFWLFIFITIIVFYITKMNKFLTNM